MQRSASSLIWITVTMGLTVIAGRADTVANFNVETSEGATAALEYIFNHLLEINVPDKHFEIKKKRRDPLVLFEPRHTLDVMLRENKITGLENVEVLKCEHLPSNARYPQGTIDECRDCLMQMVCLVDLSGASMTFKAQVSEPMQDNRMSTNHFAEGAVLFNGSHYLVEFARTRLSSPFIRTIRPQYVHSQVGDITLNIPQKPKRVVLQTIESMSVRSLYNAFNEAMPRMTAILESPDYIHRMPTTDGADLEATRQDNSWSQDSILLSRNSERR